MFHCPCTAGSNHRNRHLLCNGTCQFNIISRFRPVTVHTGKKNLAGPKLFCFFGPCNRIPSHINPSTILVDIPTTAIRPTFSINGNNNTLTAKLIRSICNKTRIIDSRRINGNLVCALTQKCPKIFYRPDTTTYGKRNKYIGSHLAHHIHHRIPMIAGRCNVKKHHLIGSGLVISRRNRHRISGIFQINKINTFDYTPVLHIQTRDNSFCKHHSLLQIRKIL